MRTIGQHHGLREPANGDAVAVTEEQRPSAPKSQLLALVIARKRLYADALAGAIQLDGVAESGWRDEIERREQVEAENHRLTAKIHALNRRIDMELERANAAARNVEGLRVDVAALETGRARLEQRIADQQGRISALVAENEKRQAALDELGGNRDRLLADLRDLNRDLDQKVRAGRDRIDGLTTECLKWDHDAEMLRERVRQLVTALELAGLPVPALDTSELRVEMKAL